MAGADDGPWVRRFHPSPDAGNRLICFPHAGSSASYFYPVSTAMPSAIEVLAIQYPGRHDRRHESNVEDLGELADSIFAAIAGRCEGRVTFFGHSMGATLAFEVARRMQRTGLRAPGSLIVSGRRGPTTHRVGTLHQKDDAALIADMKLLSGTDVRIFSDPELMHMILPPTRSDYKAIETYRYDPGPRLSCPILALVGDTDPRTTIDEARDWGQHTSSDFELQVFPGGHFYLSERPAEVIKTISDYILSRDL
jgi:surfactin synthase thioesterase subunit